MKALSLSTVVIIALLAVGGYAFAQGCSMPGMNQGGAQSSASASCHATPAAGQTLPPAENLLQITGTVVSIEPNGAALVDIGPTKVYVVARPAPTQDGTPPASPFRIGDRIQVAGILMALSVQPAPAVGHAPAAATATKQACF